MQIRNRLVLIAFALAFVAGVFLWRSSLRRPLPPPKPLTAIAVTNPPKEAVLPPGRPASARTPANLQETIALGRTVLEGSHLTMAKCGGRGEHWKRCLGDYLLAAADGAGNILVIEAYEGRPSSPPGFSVKVEDRSARRRGVNVPFQVNAPPGWTVVALRTAVWDGADIEGGVYAPYSKAIDTPEIREAGLLYLQRIAADALADLFRLRVESGFFFTGACAERKGKQCVRMVGQPIANIVEIQHVIALVLTEQMKSDVLFENGTPAERVAMVNRTLTILGANQEHAYAYVRSKKGAAGIAQLMPGTYLSLQKIYPQAELPAELDARLDHRQAMKAMVLHADNQWWAASGDRAFRQRLLVNPEARRLMLAAGYNANAGGIVTAIKTCGETWRDASCALLPTETRRYLIKYEEIWGMLYPVVHASPRLAASP